MTPPAMQFTAAYPATVYNTADPIGQNRVQLKIPQVLGTAVSQWAVPLGLVTPSPVPAVGTAVIAMFLGGDVSHPTYTQRTQTPTLFASYDAAVAQDTPVAWWKLNDAAGSTTVLDSSGHGHAGTPANVTFQQAQAVDGDPSASFNGTSSRIVTTYTAPAFTVFTAEVWVNLNNETPSGTAQIFGTANTGKAGAADEFDGFSIILDNTQTPWVNIGNGSASTQCSLGPALPASGWVQLTVTWNGTTVTCYQNEVTASTTAWAGPMGAPTNPVAIGASLGSAPTNWFRGLMSEVAIYSTALSINRVLAHYNASSAGDTISTDSLAADTVAAETVNSTSVTTQQVAGTAGILTANSGVSGGTDTATVVKVLSNANGGLVQSTDATGTYVLGHRTVRVTTNQTINSEIQEGITGLVVNVAAGNEYYFRASVTIRGLSANTAYVTMGGSCTASSIFASISFLGPGQNVVNVQTALGVNTNLESNNLANSGSPAYLAIVEGTIVVTASGALTVNAAASANETSWQVDRPSTLYVSRVNTEA